MYQLKQTCEPVVALLKQDSEPASSIGMKVPDSEALAVAYTPEKSTVESVPADKDKGLEFLNTGNGCVPHGLSEELNPSYLSE